MRVDPDGGGGGPKEVNVTGVGFGISDFHVGRNRCLFLPRTTVTADYRGSPRTNHSMSVSGGD